MTRIVKLAAAFALYATMAVAGEGTKANAKPTVDVAHTVTFTSTVKAVDQKTRVVTLLGQGGEEVTFTADNRVKNLAQLKVGDKVTVTLEESLKARVLEPGEPMPEASQTSSLTTAPLGATPAGRAKSDIHIVGTIAAIDVPNMTLTIKGAKGETWPVKARSKANLEKLKVGDVIEIRVMRDLAVAVTPAPK
jgi:ribosomal 50S subunit-recycling heat shock protein